jgi:hypothetical protein
MRVQEDDTHTAWVRLTAASQAPRVLTAEDTGDYFRALARSDDH